MVTHNDDRTRGQIILIGAIALAFIILGVVVVFNGVLYTETVSSGSSSQSASAADVTATEVNQSVECLLEALNENKTFDDEAGDKTEVANEVRSLSGHYRNTTARATPGIVNISVEDSTADVNISDGTVDYVNVTVTYDSHDLSYNRTHEKLKPDDGCVRDS